MIELFKTKRPGLAAARGLQSVTDAGIATIGVFLVAAGGPSGCAGTALAREPNPFFAMDTALRGGSPRTVAQQIVLLKGLGYAGIGASGFPNAAYFDAFTREGLKVFNVYRVLDLDSASPRLDATLATYIPGLKGRDMALWIAINTVTVSGKRLSPSDPAGDVLAATVLKELAELARPNAVRIALYPHARFWLERFEDARRLVQQVNRPNVGVTFNLCHWLKVEGDCDPTTALSNALPQLMFVTVNGADRGETRHMDWRRLIQPLDAGDYDVGALIRRLSDLGYTGPVGFQGYGIAGDPEEILRRTMSAWRRLRER